MRVIVLPMPAQLLSITGIYMNHGDICPLPDLVALKNEYKLRLFVEESYSFGSLGATGKGVTEHFDVDVNEVGKRVTLSQARVVF